MISIDASTAGRWRMEGSPRRQSMERRKNVKLIFRLMHTITSNYESSFLSLILEADHCVAFDDNGPTPSVHEKINVDVGFPNSFILCRKLVCFLGNSWNKDWIISHQKNSTDTQCEQAICIDIYSNFVMSSRTSSTSIFGGFHCKLPDSILRYTW